MTREEQIMQACEQLTESLSQFERQCFIAGVNGKALIKERLFIQKK